MTCETCGAVAVAWAMARGYCEPCWLGTFADSGGSGCQVCGAAAVAPMGADGRCVGCLQPARDCLCDPDACYKCGADFAPLCGSCSDDMGDTLDAWADADDIAPADRIPCGRCGC